MLSKIIKFLTITKFLWYTFIFFCLSTFVVSLVGINHAAVPQGIFWNITSYIIVSISGLLLLLALIGTIIIYAKEKHAKAIKKLIFVPIKVLKAKSWNIILLLIIVAGTASVWLTYDYNKSDILKAIGYVLDLVSISAITAYLWKKIGKAPLIK
ncbi:MAG: hypothetical protein LBQ45_01600 [Mycoplasmataceae bacterium]|jgi:hypothetical protein|nr:hypothetical protein [Mycoplasmataceae bacterium]